MSAFVASPMIEAAAKMRWPRLYRVGRAFGVSPTEVRRSWAFVDVLDAWLEMDGRAEAQSRAKTEAEMKHGR